MAAQNERIALVTGATDGVGRLVATKLGEAGVRVLVHGRNQERGERLVAVIAAGAGTSEFLSADLASLAEVRGLAAAVLARTDRLDILINNAGIGTAGPSPERQTSADGHELRFAVNYLAGFLLTHLLLPHLRSSAPARIVNVSSAGQQAIDFSDVMLTRGYSGTRAYCQSKLAQILFTIDLAEQLAGSGVTVNALHPASYMDTTMVRRAGVTRGGALRKAPRQSSISPSRQPSTVGAGCTSTASRRRAPTSRPTTQKRGSVCARSASISPGSRPQPRHPAHRSRHSDRPTSDVEDRSAAPRTCARHGAGFSSPRGSRF